MLRWCTRRSRKGTLAEQSVLRDVSDDDDGGWPVGWVVSGFGLTTTGWACVRRNERQTRYTVYGWPRNIARNLMSGTYI